MNTNVFSRLKSMNLRNFIALALLRVAFPELAPKVEAVVLLPLEGGTAEPPTRPSLTWRHAWSRSICIDPWHPTRPGEYLESWCPDQRPGASLDIPKRSPQSDRPSDSPVEWGFDANSPVIGETSPLPRTADSTAGANRKLSREAIAVINEATAQGNKRVLALMGPSQNAMPPRHVLEAQLGREALDKVSRACFLHDANDRTT